MPATNCQQTDPPPLHDDHHDRDSDYGDDFGNHQLLIASKQTLLSPLFMIIMILMIIMVIMMLSEGSPRQDNSVEVVQSSKRPSGPKPDQT